MNYQDVYEGLYLAHVTCIEEGGTDKNGNELLKIVYYVPALNCNVWECISHCERSKPRIYEIFLRYVKVYGYSCPFSFESLQGLPVFIWIYKTNYEGNTYLNVAAHDFDVWTTGQYIPAEGELPWISK